MDAHERWVAEPDKDPSRTEFERDRGRVLHSSALRRLGAKTQVLGPESDDFIRTRLTHSLEVAQIGRALATNLGADPDVVETSCLSHDLGHPPYGHNGERALAEVAESCGGFEGNAQTLRILTRLEPKRTSPGGRPVGLNLTRATLDAVVKYPWGPGRGPTRPDGSTSPKFGVYDEDRDVFSWIRAGRGAERCIEAQMMDLADDVAYSTHDVEDGIVRGLVRTDRLRDPAEQNRIVEATCRWYGFADGDALGAAFERLLGQENWPAEFVGTYAQLAQVKDLTSDLIGRFISGVCEATSSAHGTGSLRRHSGALVIPEAAREEIMLLKGLAVYYVMLPRESEPLYYEQRTVVYDLVDALNGSPERLEPQFLEQWNMAGGDASGRLRAVVDQVASLTDQSARQWHSRLCGFLRN